MSDPITDLALDTADAMLRSALAVQSGAPSGGSSLVLMGAVETVRQRSPEHVGQFLAAVAEAAAGSHAATAITAGELTGRGPADVLRLSGVGYRAPITEEDDQR